MKKDGEKFFECEVRSSSRVEETNKARKRIHIIAEQGWGNIFEPCPKNFNE